MIGSAEDRLVAASTEPDSTSALMSARVLGNKEKHICWDRDGRDRPRRDRNREQEEKRRGADAVGLYKHSLFIMVPE